MFNFFDAIDEAFSQIHHLAVKKQVNLKYPAVPHVLVEYFKNLYGDRKRYVQILVNFLSNAIKFSKPGGTVCLILKT